MKRCIRWTIALAALSIVIVSATGAASASSERSSSSRFGTLTVVGGAPDFVDPALAYAGTSWQLNWNVYLGLVGYRHQPGAAGAQLVPYLARSLPAVSQNGTLLKFRLRGGLRYSDGTQVRASDFKCTIERLFQINSPGVGFYGSIVGVGGADGYAAHPQGSLKGIAVNDAAGTIAIRLVGPQADFLNVLALPFAAPVPCSTPASDQSAAGVPSTGPYMVSRYQPNRSETLTRNPFFNSKLVPTVPRGNPDQIIWNVVDDPTIAAQDVVSGAADYDAEDIPNDRIGQISSQYPAQLKVNSVAVSAWFFLNTRVAPFNQLKARQAVNYAVDRAALARLVGPLGQPTQNILPSSYPQYRKIDVYRHDLAKARALVKASGTEGMTVQVWGYQRVADQVTYLASVLGEIGWKPELKIVASSIYWSTVGDQSTNAQIGYGSWGQDYPNPIDWLDTLFNGERITAVHNNNWSNADFPEVNRLIDQLKHSPQTTAAQDASWAKVERTLIAKDAAAVPYAHLGSADFFSSRVDLRCYQHHVLYGFDFSTICVK